MTEHEWVPSERVIGRWGVDLGRSLHGDARVHGARPLGDDTGPERLLEVHPVGTADGDTVVDDVRRAASITGSGLLTILDVGRTRVEETEVVYVATNAWTRTLDGTTFDDERLVNLARSLAAGLDTLHRAGLTHGALHRHAVRHVDGDWRLAPAGLGPVTALVGAPYRPPGLHVVEPQSAAADLWSLGILLHELAAGYLLRPGETPRLPGFPATERLVGSLLVADPAGRLTAEQVASGAVGQSATVHAPAPGANPAGIAPPLAPHQPAPTPAPGPAPTPGAAPHATPAPIPTPTPAGSVAGPGAGAATLAAGSGPIGGSGSSSRLLLLIAAGVVALIVVVGAVAVLTGGGDDDDTATTVDEADTDSVSTPTVDSAADDATTDDDAPTDDGSATAEGETAEEAQADGTGADDELPSPAGPIAVADLRPGDCLDVNLALGLGGTVDLVPCDQPHTAEVMSLADPEEDGDEYPGRVALQGDALDTCLDTFGDYVGSNPFESLLSPVPVPPTFTEWDSGGRRQTVCLVNLFDGTDLTESVADRGSPYRLLEGQEVPYGKLPAGRCFATDGIENVGKRQSVEAVSCNNAHLFEIISLEPLPLPEEDLARTTLDANVYVDIIEPASDICQTAWDELTAPPGLDEPVVAAFVPDEYDWQIGDRFMLCIAEWDSPVLASAVVYDLSYG